MTAVAFSILALQTSFVIGVARLNGQADKHPVAMLISGLIGVLEYGAALYCIWNGL